MTSCYSKQLGQFVIMGCNGGYMIFVMNESDWLLLIYKVPAEPSKKRLALWRKLKGLGAVYLQNGVCLLPKSDHHRRQFKIIQNEIGEMGGESFLLESSGFDRRQQELIAGRFNEERNAEYREFLGRCADYLAEIERETAARNFTYAELQENDEDLKKLKSWLEKIGRLDFYGAELAAEAARQLLLCEERLEEFSQAVFAAEHERLKSRPFPPSEENP
ncbi:ChrB domain protein [Methylococcus capsulatus]|uniref:ChrB domain protein n=2 Tax=Methylococcus capsulatus TaxID=414 RepID=A0AA35XVV6_METCP|nr:ChrB domain protein [Methylococcus capsulatus]